MIVWNRVTWYSRYLAVLFFTVVFPIWAFYLGIQYEKASSTYNTSEILVVPAPESNTNSGTTTEEEIEINSGIRGIVTIGPTCPVETMPPDPNCADKPLEASLVAINRITAVETRFSSSFDGRFSVALPPGDYSVRNTATTQLPRMESYEITVREGEYTNLDIKFDSGIR